MKRLVLAAALLAAGPAWAQSGAPSDCSGTVGQSSTAITFPAAGKTGPSRPQQYLSITNPSQTTTLAVNPTGAAAIDSSGSLSMDTVGAGWTWWAPAYPPPASINIIGSAASSPFTCKYQ